MSKETLPKIDVIMRILNRIQQGTRITVATLAEEHGVTQRTIFRYLETIQAAGYPIYYDRKEKCYRFTEGFELGSHPGKRDLSNVLDFNNQLMSFQTVGIAAYRESGGCVLANEALARLVGATREQVLAQNFRQLPSWKTAGLLDMADEVLRVGEERTKDVHFRSTFGKDVWVSATISPFKSADGAYIFLMFVDISARKQNEMALARFVAAVNQGPNLTIITDTTGRIEYASEKIVEVTGYSPSEVIGRFVSMFRSDKTPRHVYDDMWQTITKGKEWSGELRNRRKDGSLYWESIRISPIFTADGSISRYVATKEDITAQKELREELYRYATTDFLTGIFNRRMIIELGNREMSIAHRRHRPLTVMIVDIDSFKEINDTLGHLAGDEVLRHVAGACRDAIRVSDIAGRFGGDEFLVILPESDIAESLHVAERLRKAVAALPIRWKEETISCTVSIGMAEVASSDNSLEEVIEKADAALYAAKENGRDRIVTVPADSGQCSAGNASHCRQC